eukprot:68363-Pyramimonas_sp.AAC.1
MLTKEPSTTEMRQPRCNEWKGAVVHDARSTTRRVHIQSVSVQPKMSRIEPEGRDIAYPRRIPQSHFDPGSRRKAVQHFR